MTLKLGLPLLWELLLLKVYPNEITGVEDHRTSALVNLGGLALYLVLNVGLGGLMELLDVLGSFVDIHRCPLSE